MENPSWTAPAAAALAKRLFPAERLQPLGEGDLSFTCPPDDVILAGCFPGVSVLAAKELGIDYPSRLRSRFLEQARGDTVLLHAMHSAVDWFAYAIWRGGTLQRSLSLSPDSGILEDIG